MTARKKTGGKSRYNGAATSVANALRDMMKEVADPLHEQMEQMEGRMMTEIHAVKKDVAELRGKVKGARQ